MGRLAACRAAAGGPERRTRPSQPTCSSRTRWR